MFCDDCGKALNPEGRFCGGCGAVVADQSPEETPAPPVQAVPSVQATAPPVQAPVPPVQTPVPPVQAPVPPVQAPAPPVQAPVAPVQQAPVAKQGDGGFKLLAGILALSLVGVLGGGAYYLGTQSGSSQESTSSSRLEEDRDEPSSAELGEDSPTGGDRVESTQDSSQDASVEPSQNSSQDAPIVPNQDTYVSPSGVGVDGLPTMEQGSSDDFLLPNSHIEVISTQQLVGMTKEQLNIARNEIYARHGRQFADETLAAYFNSKTWYQNIQPKYEPTVFDSLSPNPLSDLELQNATTILTYQRSLP